MKSQIVTDEFRLSCVNGNQLSPATCWLIWVKAGSDAHVNMWGDRQAATRELSSAVGGNKYNKTFIIIIIQFTSNLVLVTSSKSLRDSHLINSRTSDSFRLVATVVMVSIAPK